MRGTPVPGAPHPHTALEHGLHHCKLFHPLNWRQTKARSHSYATVQRNSTLALEVNKCSRRAAVSSSKVPQTRPTSAIAVRSTVLQQPAWAQEAFLPRQCMTYQDPWTGIAGDISRQHSQQALQHSRAPGSRCDSGQAVTNLWPVSEAGEVDVFVEDDREDTKAPQELHHSRHRHRHKSSHGSGLQQLHPEQQCSSVQQPESHSSADVDLLQQVVLVRSWSNALRVLQQYPQLKQSHVGLLWRQLQPKLQARETASRARSSSSSNTQNLQPHHVKKQKHQQRNVQRVLVQLCRLTQQLAHSMTPQSLAFTLQGLAAAIRAGDMVLVDHAEDQQQNTPSSVTAVSVSCDVSHLLWYRLLAVAGSCTAQQLTRCLSAGLQLGWHLNYSGSPAHLQPLNSSWNICCCWPILEAACNGQLAESCDYFQHKCDSSSQQQHTSSDIQRVSGSEAGELLAALTALLMQAQQQQSDDVSIPQHEHVQPSGDRSSWQQQHPMVHQTVLKLVKQAACPSSSSSSSSAAAAAAAASSHSLGQGITYTYPPGALTSRKLTSRPPGSAAHLNCQQQAPEAAAAAASVLQSAAVLGVALSHGDLEQLVLRIEPWLGVASVSCVLQVLQALTDLQVEPWQSWMTACMARIESELHLLAETQLLQLLLLLPQVQTVELSQQLLQKLARLTAKYCCRYSWSQLAVLPLCFAELQYTPPALWLKDYLAATSAVMHQQQLQWDTQLTADNADRAQNTQRLQQQVESEQKQQLHTEQLQLYAQMLTGILCLGPPSPPAAWLSHVESVVLLHIRQLPFEPDPASCHLSVAAATKQVLQAFEKLHHQPSQQFVVKLNDVCSCVDEKCQQEGVDGNKLWAPGQELGSEMQDTWPSLAAGPDSGSAACSSSTSRESFRSGITTGLLWQRQSEDVAQAQATEVELETELNMRLCKPASQRSSFELLVEGGWKHQRVCISNSSKRLFDWGVLLKQRGAMLATL